MKPRLKAFIQGTSHPWLLISHQHSDSKDHTRSWPHHLGTFGDECVARGRSHINISDLFLISLWLFFNYIFIVMMLKRHKNLFCLLAFVLYLDWIILYLFELILFLCLSLFPLVHFRVSLMFF